MEYLLCVIYIFFGCKFIWMLILKLSLGFLIMDVFRFCFIVGVKGGRELSFGLSWEKVFGVYYIYKE